MSKNVSKIACFLGQKYGRFCLQRPSLSLSQLVWPSVIKKLFKKIRNNNSVVGIELSGIKQKDSAFINEFLSIRNERFMAVVDILRAVLIVASGYGGLGRFVSYELHFVHGKHFGFGGVEETNMIKENPSLARGRF